MGYRIEVVIDDCMSSGKCVGDYPQTFDFDDEELATLIEDGEVMGGGYVGEGSGTIILNGQFLHPKARAGYGGDGRPEGGADQADTPLWKFLLFGIWVALL